MGLFDWLDNGRRDAPLPPVEWHVYRVDQCGLPFDELTEKMFSRVGQYTPAGEA